MCCQVKVKPLDKLLVATIFEVGQFEITTEPVYKYIRRLDEGALVKAGYNNNDELLLTIWPTVNNMTDHTKARLPASVMFEMAWRYAEKIDGEIWQLANIGLCREEHGNTASIIALPLQPFRWEDVCLGFRQVML